MALRATATRSGAAIRTSDLGMVYGSGATRVHALREVGLSVPAGQFLCIMGPSGSGKSTLLHLLAGLRAPTRGDVWIGETRVHALSEDAVAVFRRRHVGLIYQFFNLLDSMSVRQNVALPLLMDGVPMRHARERVDALLERLSLVDRVDHGLSQLSGGQLQRIAIARALVTQPDVVLADEPTGNLDAAASDVVLGLLRELCGERGATTIVVTHDAAARAYADRVVRIRDGRIHEGPETSENGTAPDREGHGA